MKSLLITLCCLFLINSCGEETNPYEYKTCDLSNIVVTDVTGRIYQIGTNATNDWYMFYKGIRVSETIFGFSLRPNPVNNVGFTNFFLNKDSRVKIFLNDSLMVDNFFKSGYYTIDFDFTNKEDGCYKLRAEFYYGATKSNDKSDTILTSSGTMILDKARKYTTK